MEDKAIHIGFVIEDYLVRKLYKNRNSSCYCTRSLNSLLQCISAAVTSTVFYTTRFSRTINEAKVTSLTILLKSPSFPIFSKILVLLSPNWACCLLLRSTFI